MSNQPDASKQSGHLHYQYPQNQQQFGQYPPYPQHPTVGFQPQLGGQNPPPPFYQQQPFPAPIQQQPNYAPTTGFLSNGDFSAYLRNTTSFHVKQKFELFEAIVGWETTNKYTVKDNAGNKVFFVGEETGCCSRMCFGASRPFELVVKDTRGADVLRFSRPVDCSCCFGLIWPDTVTVTTASGHKLGSIVQAFSIIGPKLTLLNSAGEAVMRLVGPPCVATCGSWMDIVFSLMTMDGIEVGKITKKWSGLLREMFTDADCFSITFPIDLHPEMKAVCLAALFLIDFEYFEKSND